jgi:hypothetical protein
MKRLLAVLNPRLFLRLHINISVDKIKVIYRMILMPLSFVEKK